MPCPLLTEYVQAGYKKQDGQPPVKCPAGEFASGARAFAEATACTRCPDNTFAPLPDGNVECGCCGLLWHLPVAAMMLLAALLGLMQMTPGSCCWQAVGSNLLVTYCLPSTSQGHSASRDIPGPVLRTSV
jgi:hypothetical protein